MASLRRLPKVFRVLALESSADDSCASIVSSDRKILSNIVIKQHEMNKKYGGIHPIKAQDGHMASIPVAIRQALDQAKLKVEDIDVFAYTRGPGMFGCLTCCATAARALASSQNKPTMAIHHMQAHALSVYLTEETPPEFPFLTLLVSGGHTMLVLATGMEDFRILANSVDDSMGDAYDKTSRLLQIPELPDLGPGPSLEHYADFSFSTPSSTLDIYRQLPAFKKPMAKQLAFSFAGLKNAVSVGLQRYLQSQGQGMDVTMGLLQDECLKKAMAKRFQECAVGHVIEKVGLGLNLLSAEGLVVKGLVMSGGVASNQFLRQSMARYLASRSPDKPLPVVYPPVALCTDNAAMIAWTAIQRIQTNGEVFDAIDVGLKPKWSLEKMNEVD